MESRVKKVEDEIREYMWTQQRKDVEDETKMTLLESRLAALEVDKEEDWTPAHNNRRQVQRAPYNPSKNMIQKLEGKVNRMEGAWHDLPILRSRIEKVEGTVGSVEGVKTRVAEAEKGLRVFNLQITSVRAQVAEFLLRQHLLSRGTPSGRTPPPASSLPRISQLEHFRQEAVYRLRTLEEQVVLIDRVLGCFWMTYTAPNAAEANIRTSTLRAVWDVATEHYTRRMKSLEEMVANTETDTAAQSTTIPPFVPTSSTNHPANANNPSTSY